MRISILGTGAIGGYYGVMLANAGHEVNFLLRGDFEHVAANGLTLKSRIHGDVVLSEVNAFKDPLAMPKAEVVLVCLKTTQNNGALLEILPHLADHGSIVLLIQNGLGMEQELSRHFPGLQIAGGVAVITSYKDGEGVIVHQDHGNLDMGSFSVNNTAMLQEFVDSLRRAGVQSSIKDLEYLRWKKLVWNMAFNGLSVVLDMDTREILADKVGMQLSRSIMQEVVEAAKACGVILPANFADDMLQFTLAMAPYRPSMKLDFDLSRPMEIEYLYYQPIKRASECGFEMVLSKSIYDKLNEIQGLIANP